MPKGTKDYEKTVKLSALSAGAELTDKPVSVSFTAVFRIPKSVSKKKRAGMIGSPVVKKPDIDNIAKIILDGMQGTVFSDDKTVYEISGRKIYGDDPRVEVTVEELPERIHADI